MSQESEILDQLPDAIVERLKAHDTAVPLLTPDVDRRIRSAAQAQFAPRQSRPVVRRWYVPAAAAAAAALVAILITRPVEQDALVEAARVESEVLADDVDASGRVDILDVFALARARRDDPEAASQDRIDSLTTRIVSLDLPEALL